MTSHLHYFIECQNPACRFRFPVSGRRLTACPNCRQANLKITPIEPSPVEGLTPFPSNPFRGALLDNIRSIHNVGSIFRTADGLSLEHLYLCGITSSPEHPRLAKTALGSQQTIRWSHHLNGVDTIRSLIDDGYTIWALEGGSNSVDMYAINKYPSASRIILVVGNEITGVDPEIIKLSHSVIYIPMQGVKGSLNVSVAFGIAAYHLRFVIS